MTQRDSKIRRHILPISGGKDSAALAVYLKDKISDLEYVFLDTGHELPETYEYLKRIQAILGIKITILKSKRDFDFWLKIFDGCLPSPQNRWCTRELKISPYEKYIGRDRTISYIALRADENRTGYIRHKKNIIPYYPFIDDNLTKFDIIGLLEESGLGLPSYYEWRSRSGCYFCFFQRKIEWINLYQRHPDLFRKSHLYESNHKDGRTYTWIENQSLVDLIKNKEKIMKKDRDSFGSNKKYLDTKLKNRLSSIKFTVNKKSMLSKRKSFIDKQKTDESEDNKPCMFCTL